jgi:hypothetical protein
MLTMIAATKTENRFGVPADEMLTVFLELDRQLPNQNCL